MIDGLYYSRECECGLLTRHRMDSKLSFANLPDMYKDSDIRQFSTKVYRDAASKQQIKGICRAVKEWLDHYEDMKAVGKGLYFYSATKGSGKTYLVACIANELIKAKKAMVKFTTSAQILSEIRSTWGNREAGQYTESKLINDLGKAEVLIIDDFGTETVKDWVNERFYSIINDRYVNRKITLITANMSLKDQKYDDRITNRLLERCYVLPFPEESVREHIAEEMGGIV